jgi:hypothetical protein
LKELLNEPDEEIEEEEDIKDTVNKKYMKRLETVVKKELKNTNALAGSGDNSGTQFDIELIRKVIKEELAGRPETTVIKKELVETLVDKIVENSTTAPQALPIQEVLETESVSSKKETSSKELEVTPESNSGKESKSEPVTPSTQSSEENPVEPVKEVLPPNKLIVSELPNEIDNISLENLLDDDNELVEIKPPSTSTPATPNPNTTNSTDSIVEINGGGDGKGDGSSGDGSSGDGKGNAGIDKNIISKIDIDDDEIVIDDMSEKIGSSSDKPKNELKISKIEEINLNLDELDSDSELEASEINLKSIPPATSNEVKKEQKDETTKYIFFNDAPK